MSLLRVLPQTMAMFFTRNFKTTLTASRFLDLIFKSQVCV